MVKVAILGIGTVGGGTAEVLTKNRELIARRAGQEIELKYILCRRARPDHPFAHLIVHDIDTIVNDPEIGVVAECIGGATLAYEYDRRCLEACGTKLCGEWRRGCRGGVSYRDPGRDALGDRPEPGDDLGTAVGMEPSAEKSEPDLGRPTAAREVKGGTGDDGMAAELL